MVDDKMVETTLEDWDEIMRKAFKNEEFSNTEVIQLLWAKVILEKEMGD